MIQRTLLLPALLCCLIAAPMAAKHSDDFVLGTYTYFDNDGHHALRLASLGQMNELGYNSNIMETFRNSPDLARMLSEMDSLGIDAWIIDRSWVNSLKSEHRFASYPLSASNYLRFEAEFDSEADVKPGDGMDNQYWYASRSDENITRVGSAAQNPDASYGWTWRAVRQQDAPGYVFSDLRYRWPNRNGFYVRSGREFMLYQKDPAKHEGDFLWVTLRFRLGNIGPGLNPDEPLLKISLAGYELAGGGFSNKEQVLNHLYLGQTRQETVFTLADYRLLSQNGFVELQLQVPYTELLSAKLMSADHDGNASTNDSREWMRMINFNPRVYWYGNCDLELDYVEMEDQIHRDLAKDAGFWRDGIQSRVRNLISQGAGNVSGFYTFDEPFTGQFDTHRLLDGIAADMGTKMFTAIYDYQGDNYVLDKERGILYDHVDAFRKIAQPTIIGPDIYPLTPDLEWNGQPGGKFIQDVLDRKLLKVYRDSKLYRDAKAGREFYPIVQVLGNWINSGGKDQWVSWIQPPTATQKALLYLPLCYGPDGIFHFRMRAFHDAKGYGHRGVTYSQQGGKDYPLPQKDPVTWPAVESSNHRVLAYGKIVRNLTWLESEAIGTAKCCSKSWRQANFVRSAQVLPTGRGDYEGYVQCAYYQDEQETPWFMVVNRRGNYFRPVAAQSPNVVPPGEIGQHFPEAEPQTLQLKFNLQARQKYGNSLALRDPYDGTVFRGKNGVIEIVLPAGEGRLLQLVRQ